MLVSLCVTFQELLLCEVQSLSCQAQLHLSTEDPLWGLGVAAVWFRSFQLQVSNPSPMHPEVCSAESSTYCLHCPTQYFIKWQDQPASLSDSQPSLSVCLYWMGLAFARLSLSCSTLNETAPHLHTLSICFAHSYATTNLHPDYTLYRCVCQCVAERACL